MNCVFLDGHYSTRFAAGTKNCVTVKRLDGVHAYHTASDALLHETVSCLERCTKNSARCDERDVAAFANRACFANVKNFLRAGSCRRG